MNHANPSAPARPEAPQADLLDAVLSDWRRERPDLDASALAVVGRIIQLGGAMKASASQALEPYDLHYTDLDVLATLRRSGASYRLTPTRLMKSVLLTSGAMTATLRRLEGRGLISRSVGEGDARMRLVMLTDTGLALIEKAIEERFREAAVAVAGLSDEEREHLSNLLRKLTVALT